MKKTLFYTSLVLVFLAVVIIRVTLSFLPYPFSLACLPFNNSVAVMVALLSRKYMWKWIMKEERTFEKWAVNLFGVLAILEFFASLIKVISQIRLNAIYNAM